MTYGEGVARLLELAGAGERLLPLTAGAAPVEAARREIARRGAAEWFPEARAPQAALAGLYLYFSCFDDAHSVAQSVPTADGSFWHGILHRQEPDADNARYWFRRTGAHPVFPRLLARAQQIGTVLGETSWAARTAWDPEEFIELCERARLGTDSKLERLALEIQRAEWQLLFDHCARSGA